MSAAVIFEWDGFFCCLFFSILQAFTIEMVFWGFVGFGVCFFFLFLFQREKIFFRIIMFNKFKLLAYSTLWETLTWLPLTAFSIKLMSSQNVVLSIIFKSLTWSRGVKITPSSNASCQKGFWGLESCEVNKAPPRGWAQR